MISKKPKIAKPTIDKSTIDPSKSKSKEEYDKMLNDLINVESRWRVYSSETLADMLYEISKKEGYIWFGLLSEAFKRVLAVHQYDPSGLDISMEAPIKIDEDDNLITFGDMLDDDNNLSIDDEMLEDILEDDWYQLFAKSGINNLSNISENLLFEILENEKEFNFESYKIFMHFIEQWIKLVQSNLDEPQENIEIWKEIKNVMGKNEYNIAKKLYNLMFNLVIKKQKDLNNEKVEEIAFFGSLLKYKLLVEGKN